MKKFLGAVKFWASLSGPGKYRKHIWKWLFQFGDWCAPGEGIKDWMGKGKWVATAYYAKLLRHRIGNRLAAWPQKRCRILQKAKRRNIFSIQKNFY